MTQTSNPSPRPAEDIKAQATALVLDMIKKADARNMAYADTMDSPTARLHAHTDAMRDLRDALRELGVIA